MTVTYHNQLHGPKPDWFYLQLSYPVLSQVYTVTTMIALSALWRQIPKCDFGFSTVVQHSPPQDIVLTSLCAFWYCPGCAVILALFVDFRWSVKISWRMGDLEEQDDAVVGVFCPPPPPFQSTFWSIDYIKCTLLALAATSLEQTWLNESGWVSFTSWMYFMWYTRSLCFSTHLVSLAS